MQPMNVADRAHEGRSSTLNSTVEAHDTVVPLVRLLIGKSASMRVFAPATNMSLSSSLSFPFVFLFPVHLLACTRGLSRYIILYIP